METEVINAQEVAVAEESNGRGVRLMLYVARAVSLVFTPFYLPLVGLAALFLFSYIRYFMRWQYILLVFFIVWLFTVALPQLTIRYYRKFLGWTRADIGRKERRMVPYIISIVSYFMCYHLMNMLGLPHFLSSIILASLAIQVLFAIVNIWWKISTHSGAIGGVAGALTSFSFLFHFNPVWWLCLIILLAGIVGTSRMVLRQHTLSQVVCGFLLGFFCAFFVIIFI